MPFISKIVFVRVFAMIFFEWDIFEYACFA
jgi:hypothetical protein